MSPESQIMIIGDIEGLVRRMEHKLYIYLELTTSKLFLKIPLNFIALVR